MSAPATVPASQPASSSDVAAALDRVAGLSPWLGGRTDAPPEGAPDLAALAADPGHLDALARRCAERLETDRLDVAAGLLFHDLAWRVVAPALSAAFVAGTAPALGPDDVTVVLDERGASTAVHFTAAGGHRSATTAEQRGELPRRVRDDVVVALAPLVAAIRPLARRGEPALWGEVADTIASTMHMVGELVGRGEAARAVADDLLDGTRPIRGGTNWVPVDHAGLSCTWRVRNACCKAYELAQHDYCASCPLLAEDEQLARFRALNEAQATASAG